jgi:hypothetical protein
MTTTFTDHLMKVWQELKEAVRNEDWPATQQSFHRMEKIQQVNEEFAKKLEEEIGDAFGGPPLTVSKPMVELNGVRRGTIRPAELRIGSDRIPISLNNQIVVATGNWIIKQGHTIPPIRNFVHRDNSGFSPSAQTKRLDDGSFIEVGDSQRTLVVKAPKLLDFCGFRNTKIEVHLEDGAIIN